ncbi:Salicylic acid-binding protein 2 [Linum grandiflorum]
MAEQISSEKSAHFVLVHGACHGAWSWFKVKPLLESAGHRVTVLDLAASGIDSKSIHQVPTFRQYTQPLLDVLAASDDKSVILVGHSLGGLNLALAMKLFPNKISVAVFLTAFMPDTIHSPSFVLDQYNAKAPPNAWLDTEFAPAISSDPDFVTMYFGPEFLTSRLYQLCTKQLCRIGQTVIMQDLELAKTLVRPSSLYIHDLSRAEKFTEEGYGSVRRVFVICEQDEAINVEFQRWMIQNYAVEEVMEINDSDHMPMLCQPIKLCDLLNKIARKH